VVRANAHNLIIVTALAVLGFFFLRMLRRTRVANWPVVGQALQLVPAA